jgi:DNA-directed RNA polymerase specialized sigma24 family protein
MEFEKFTKPIGKKVYRVCRGYVMTTIGQNIAQDTFYNGMEELDTFRKESAIST